MKEFKEAEMPEAEKDEVIDIDKKILSDIKTIKILLGCQIKSNPNRMYEATLLAEGALQSMLKSANESGSKETQIELLKALRYCFNKRVNALNLLIKEVEKNE